MRRIAILGAGPIGLEAALAAAARGDDFEVFEAAPTVGGHLRRWSHVRTFTPWSMNVSPRMRAALPAAPGGAGLPTGGELADELLEPVAALPALRGRIRLNTRVLAVGREGLLKHEAVGEQRRAEAPLRLLVAGPDGEEAIVHADVVIDATGTYGTPNRLGDGGIDAVNERLFDDRVERYLPAFEAQPGAWAGRTILLTGAGHSAQTAARRLAEFACHAPGTRVVWAIRNPAPDWGNVDGDPLPERASLGAAAAQLAAGASGAIALRAGHVTEALHGRGDGRIAVTLRNGQAEELEVDRILALNGGVGDHGLYRQLQVHECYATSGPMKLAASLLTSAGAADCLAVPTPGPETLRNPEPGFFILGAKSYGRNSQFLLRVGWQQVDDVFGALI
ncbi:MAG TPA: NAD(P)-binding protein [Solirubrobacteraceae bacterium]|nr:NAD(P)-binding protein [Solirubrobacteraceae bacterium]